MKTNTTHWIVYDGNCGTCLVAKKLFTSLKFIPESQCLNFHTLPEHLFNKVSLERFKHGMAYVHDGSEPTRYGLHGITSAFAVKYPVFRKLKPGTLLFRFLNYFYNTLCHNRYFLFPIKKTFACDCEPTFEARYFRRWLGIGLLFLLATSSLLGLVLAKATGAAPAELAWQIASIVGVGWLVSLILARLLMSLDHYRDYARHLAVIFAVGAIVLVPALFFFWLPSQVLLILLLLSMAMSTLMMLRIHFQRMRFMGLHPKWTFSWFLSLQATACVLAIHFQIVNL